MSDGKIFTRENLLIAVIASFVMLVITRIAYGEWRIIQSVIFFVLFGALFPKFAAWQARRHSKDAND